MGTRIYSVLLLVGLISVVHSVPFLKEDPKPQCEYKSCNPGKEGYINVHLVPHTHDDVGWVKTVDEYFYGSNLYVSPAAVQYILDTVVDSLQRDTSRKFIYVETAFFWKWWMNQDDEIKNIFTQLVNSGQLEFISGGWSMHDEATTNYQSIIDQMTWGLRRLNDTFGTCGVPKVAWQIDPFGHSRESANIFKQIGFDAFILNRIDYQDKSKRAQEKQLEFIWKTSEILDDSNIFTSTLLKHYDPPNGLCFDSTCTDDPIIDDVESPDYNVELKLDYFYTHVNTLVNSYRTKNVLVTMGSDFQYQNAEKWFQNLDKLISIVNGKQVNGSLYNAFYSTPSCYIKAVYDETKGRINTTMKTDDFFPYASDENSYWTGYFSSRTALKRFERIGNNFLQVCKQLTTLTNLDSVSKEKLTLLREAMGVLQHHDAISGTEKRAVASDYARLLHKGITSCENITFSALNKLISNTTAEPTTEIFTDLPDLQMTTCPLTNLSQCGVSENEESFIVTVYNPLGRPVNKFVRLPVTGTAYAVTDPEGNTLLTDLIPIAKSVQILPGRNSTATVELNFLAKEVPPLGYRSYFIKKTTGNDVVVQDNSTSIANSTKVGVALDPKTGFLRQIQVDNTNYEVNQSFWYYFGNPGINAGPSNRASGAYVFRPSINLPNDTSNFVNVTNKTEFYEIYRGKVVTEIHQLFNNWTSQIIRLYEGEGFVEFDWLIGSPSETGLPVTGKEFVTKFETKLNTSKTFYTDSNGRQIISRVRDYRPTWNVQIAEPESGNYYPVVSKILLRDPEANVDFAVLTDRAQGGSSLKDGEVELMIYRNCLYDDGFGVGEALVETQFDTYIAVRGSHYVFIGPTGSPISKDERELEVSKLLDSWVFLAPANGYTFESYKDSHRMEFSGLTRTLPNDLHVMTLEPWKESTLLLRLEHLNTESNDVSVDIQDLFSTFKIKSVKETTLGANQWLEDSKPLKFTQVDANGNSIYKEDSEATTKVHQDENVFNITLSSTQIRTFIVEIE